MAPDHEREAPVTCATLLMTRCSLFVIQALALSWDATTHIHFRSHSPSLCSRPCLGCLSHEVRAGSTSSACCWACCSCARTASCPLSWPCSGCWRLWAKRLKGCMGRAWTMSFPGEGGACAHQTA